MSVPVKRKCLVLKAEYVPQRFSILLLVEIPEGRFRVQIHRNDLASYGDRTVDEIERELHKTAKMMIGKKITLVFDPDLKDRVDANAPINY